MRYSALVGCAAGVMSGLWMWMEYAVGLHTSHADIGRFTGFLSVIFPILGFYLALRAVRQSGLRLDAWTTARHVAVVTAAATISMSLMAAAYATWIHPEWLSMSGTTVAGFVLQSAIASAVGGLILGAIVRATMRPIR